MHKIYLHNTLSRAKEEFTPIDEKEVRMYSCGPTVYNYPHIGNYRAYIFADTLKRVLSYGGYRVKHIMNLTDVDDKTIRNSQKENRTLKEFTEFYTEAFFKDIKSLNILPPTKFTKATDYVDEMVEMIKKLLENRLAYKSDDGSIYFDIKQFPNYGKLSGVVLEKQKENASGRIISDEYDKENAQDFALWKAWDEEDGEVFWDTEFGRGRPGWHIECSAMSISNLGQELDIHTGGVDNIFPHHENEIAQSEGATGKQFVKYWMHNEWVLVDQKKMAKSANNFYTLKDITDRGISPV
ncbi:MAG: cysteine--tRNA ligase, partial [Candidatus Pacebacteria bacterium]|nr:cysteine--tRNA ligase [Candidatus Paceibacterota bacterium]